MNNNVSGQKTGMKCPLCGVFIETTVFILMTSSGLHCAACGLFLKIDRMKSRAALDALRKVLNAQENLEKKSRFNR
ncbi:MAG: hypothetical protein LIO79_05435 [Rikenellaceae bacterium]|nr:hypothetical protein [Rikenellaceae bacterium]